jgi:urease accessory protein
MHLIHHAIAQPHSRLPRIALKVPRQTLAKRRWRSRAQDGADFGFELDSPLKHGEVVFQNSKSAYVIEQEPEQVLLIRFGNCAEAASVAWQIGNLHFPVAVEEGGLLVEDDIAIRQMLERQQISFTAVDDVFQPLRAAGAHHHHDQGGGHAEIGHNAHVH